MPAGSAVIFEGALWHRGGANRSAGTRLAVSPEYCQPWLRPQESQLLIVPPDRARACSARARSMLGYNIHPPFVGQVDGMHPLRLVDPDYRQRKSEAREVADRVLARPLAAMTPEKTLLPAARPLALRVVAAVIERAGKLLLCQRPIGKHHGGLWEFPGGRIEPGEGPGEALARELREELELTLVNRDDCALLYRDDDEARAVVIEFLSARVEGEPRCLEHQALCWVSPEEALSMPLAPANLRFVELAVRRLRGGAMQFLAGRPETG